MIFLWLIGLFLYIFIISCIIFRRWEDRKNYNGYWTNDFAALVWVGGLIGAIMWPLSMAVIAAWFATNGKGKGDK